MNFLQPRRAVTLQDLVARLAASPHLEYQPCEDRDLAWLTCCLGGWPAPRRAQKPGGRADDGSPRSHVHVAEGGAGSGLKPPGRASVGWHIPRAPRGPARPSSPDTTWHSMDQEGQMAPRSSQARPDDLINLPNEL